MFDFETDQFFQSSPVTLNNLRMPSDAPVLHPTPSDEETSAAISEVFRKVTTSHQDFSIAGISSKSLILHALDRASYSGPVGAVYETLSLLQRFRVPNAVVAHFQGATPKSFDFHAWAVKTLSDLHMVSEDNALGLVGNVYCDASYRERSETVNMELRGPKEEVQALCKSFRENMPEPPVQVHWAFLDSRNDVSYSSSKLQRPKPITGSFAWLGKPVEEYIKDFIESSSPVLILLGPPGTGKTSFLKELAMQMKTNLTVTFDPVLLSRDDFFSSFLDDSDTKLLVMEDADTSMGLRVEGNMSMQRFLNVSDGLVSAPKKKIVLTANLASTDEIDPAFMRKGRCFDVVHTRALSYEEAKIVAENFYGPDVVIEKKDHLLSDLLNRKDPSAQKSKPSIGFLR